MESLNKQELLSLLIKMSKEKWEKFKYYDKEDDALAERTLGEIGAFSSVILALSDDKFYQGLCNEYSVKEATK